MVALLVLKDGADISLDNIKEYCRGKIAGYKIPKAIKCVKEIPRNHTGKTVKHQLVALFDE